MTPLPEIKLPDKLQALVQHCESYCNAGCCGIDAFVFSPLYVTAYLAAGNGRITRDDIAQWEAELQKAEGLIADLLPNEKGYVCSIECMNTYFTPAQFQDFLAELRQSIRVSPRVQDFCNQLWSEA